MNQRCLSPISISDRNFSFLYISSVELKRGYMSDVGKDSFKECFLNVGLNCSLMVFFNHSKVGHSLVEICQINIGIGI